MPGFPAQGRISDPGGKAGVWKGEQTPDAEKDQGLVADGHSLRREALFRRSGPGTGPSGFSGTGFLRTMRVISGLIPQIPSECFRQRRGSNRGSGEWGAYRPARTVS